MNLIKKKPVSHFNIIGLRTMQQQYILISNNQIENSTPIENRIKTIQAPCPGLLILAWARAGWRKPDKSLGEHGFKIQ